MSPRSSTKSTLFTTDFRRAFEAETSSLLARRFLWFTGIVAAFSLVWSLIVAPRIATTGGGPLLASIAIALIFGSTFAWVWRGGVTRDRLLGSTYWLVIAYGTVQIAVMTLTTMPDGSAHTPWMIVARITGVHLLAALFLPWTPWQAIHPIIVLVILNAGAMAALSSLPWTDRLATIALSLLVGLPGVVVCWVRQGWRLERSKLRFLQSRYGQVRRDLVDARKLHESLFPAPITQGPLRLHYAYEPMRQIGGDFIFFRQALGADQQAVCVLADVTGHGVAAALTVNRLHGELERLLAMHPDITPGRLLADLNHYVHLTLAPHSVFVTALAVRIDPLASTLVHASGGHPPAFIRAVDGTIEELESTSFMLGACPPDDFEADEHSARFCPGDALIAYTDGATEATNANQRQFGIDNIRRLIASVQIPTAGSWPGRIIDAVSDHRHGPPGDDTLVIEVARPIGAPLRTRPAVVPSSTTRAR